ncbi:MAG TPA: alpha/beta hydrolase [Gammaproteobacteria bacterium]|nr:alpha/beta hydrolase [Gammaproteobacteria bacterium]
MRASANGAELFYSIRGEGPPCLMPCSLGTRSNEVLTSELSRHFTLIYADIRGSGESSGEPRDLDFDVMADDFDAVCRAAGFDRVAVLGYSIQGILAIEYGRRRAERVTCVIAVGTPPRGDMQWLAAESTRFFEADASEERKNVLRDNFAKLAPGHSLADAVAAQTPMRFFDARFDAAPLVAAAEGRPGILEHLLGPLTNGWSVTEHADERRVPIFVAHGRYDYVVPHRLWEDALPALPRATFRLFERSGHQPFFEEPEEFVQALRAWRSLPPSHSIRARP